MLVSKDDTGYTLTGEGTGCPVARLRPKGKRGDFQVLTERGRRALRVHLGKDLESCLAKLAAAFRSALN